MGDPTKSVKGASGGSPVEHEVRQEVRASDVEAVRSIVRATGFFSDDEVSIAAELVEERLRDGLASGYEFLFADRDGKVQGYSCFGEVPGTSGSYDLYWIAVGPSCQGAGLGTYLMQCTEAILCERGARRVFAETSGRAQYAPTRKFYLRCGYALEATLADFYASGDDKLIFGKELQAI